MANPTTPTEQDARVLTALVATEAQVSQKEQQNAELKRLVQEKKQLVQRLASFLREVEAESTRLDQAIAQTTRELARH